MAKIIAISRTFLTFSFDFKVLFGILILVIIMKYLSKITKIKTFTFDDFVHIVNDKNLAKNTLRNYIQQGYIKRIRHNLYSPISLETNECIADKFFIGASITETSFISHHSAFEFYGYYHQVYHVVNVSSISKFNSFEFEDNEYCFIKVSSDSFVEKIRGVKVSSIERTIVDSIKDSGKYIELEETLNCMKLIPYISIKDILKYLEQVNSKMLYKKVGFILSLFKEQWNISESFFQKCHEVSDSVKGYFDKNKEELVYNAEWRVFIYKDLYNYISKE